MNNTITHIEYLIDDKTKVYVIDISSKDINSIIEKSVVSICEGCSNTDVSTIKIKLYDYLKKKKYKQRIGAIAEFYIHLYLKDCGYKQEFLFFNLEENSIKKGFDGYYTFNGEEWIVESKSGVNVSHRDKIIESYNDLKDKLTTKKKNNPWENAYNHAAHFAVKADETIVKKLKALSNDYYKNIHLPLEEFNLIPCGTVFEHDASLKEIKDKVFDTLVDLSKNMNYKKICIMAISNRAFQAFLNFIGLENEE